MRTPHASSARRRGRRAARRRPPRWRGRLPARPAKPGAGPAEAAKGPFKTLTVCKQAAARYRTIQKAVNKAKAGDTSRSPTAPTARACRSTAPRSATSSSIGNPTNPAKVVLDGKGLKGAAAQNGVLVNGADEVTVSGFTATQLQGQRLLLRQRHRLHARPPARDARPASTASTPSTPWAARCATPRPPTNNDAGFYIGQTPAQTKPIRSIVTQRRRRAATCSAGRARTCAT